MIELFKLLISWGKQHKGFAGFAALFLVILLAALFTWLSSSNASPLLATAGYIIIVAVFLLLVMLLVMVFIRGATPAKAVIYVVVHEEGNEGILIEDAKVTLLLPVPVSQLTQPNGGAVFVVQTPAWIGKLFSIRADKSGYASGESQKIKITDGRQIKLSLTPLPVHPQPPTPPLDNLQSGERSVTFNGPAERNLVMTGDHNKINPQPELPVPPEEE